MHGLFRGVSCAAITVLAGALVVTVPAAGADELGAITGTVSTEGSAAAAAAAEVTLYDSSDVLIRTVAADASGGYTVPGLAPGCYRLHFAAGGPNAARYLPEWWDNAAHRDAAQAVTVVGSETVTLGDAQLSPAPRSPAPVITGSATVGQTLTGTTGDWSPTPDGFGYQWYTDAGTAPTPIAGATAASYLVTPADLGHHLSVEVTANRAGADPIVEQSTATAAVVAGQFRTAPTPTLSGTAAVGQTLRATAGTWAPTATLSYQWFRGSTAIARATASTYLLAAADGATHVSVRVTATASGYVPTTRASAQTGWVQKLLTRGTPRVTGTAKYGQVLTASPGTWGPSGVTLRYQWYLATAPIAGATTSSYRPSVGTIGKPLHVTVTGSKSGYLSATQTSAAVKVAAASFTSVPTPKITGTPKVGVVLKVSVAASAPAASSLRLQWRSNGTAIAGATSSSFRVRPTDVDKQLTVLVTVVRTGYTSVARSSAATARATGLAYSSCASLNAVYPHGVAKAGVTSDRVSGVARALKGPPFFSSSLYALNTDRDGDKDGISCER